MVSKILGKMEVLRGFILVPTGSRFDLIGDIRLPCFTELNGEPARIDKYGRLWSSYLKRRFSVGTRVELSKTENGYQVISSETEQKDSIRLMKEKKVISVSHEPDNESRVYCKVLQGDCLRYLDDGSVDNIHLTFLDPPYRQGKEYRFFDDNQSEEKYWNWLKEILSKIHDITVEGGAIYFMQREKNAEQVLKVLRETNWKFQNLIIWKKKTSAVPSNVRFSKQYQIISFSTRGDRPRIFNKLRIDYPLSPGHKYPRKNGIYATDVWDDIRELTSGYFAGDEAIRDNEAKRVHTQQSPVALLLRIVLSSSLPGDTVFDPLAGTGTTIVVANQLGRNSVGIEIDPEHVKTIKSRLKSPRPSDDVSRYYNYYRFTPDLEKIWQPEKIAGQKKLV